MLQPGIPRSQGHVPAPGKIRFVAHLYCFADSLGLFGLRGKLRCEFHSEFCFSFLHSFAWNGILRYLTLADRKVFPVVLKMQDLFSGALRRKAARDRFPCEIPNGDLQEKMFSPRKAMMGRYLYAVEIASAWSEKKSEMP